MSSYYGTNQFGISKAVNSPYGSSLFSSYIHPPKTGSGYIGSSGFASAFNPSMIPGYGGGVGNPPQAPAPAPAAQGGGGGGAPNLSNLDFSSDPILQKIQALTNQQISDATAEAIRQRTQLAIGYGDPALAKQLDLKGKTGEQAANNPFSTLAELGRAYTRRNVFDINRPLSDQANLFYSSERGRQLALSGEQNLRDRSQAGNAVQSRIAEISQQLLQAKLAAQMQLLQAEQEAYQRALQTALYSAGVG